MVLQPPFSLAGRHFSRMLGRSWPPDRPIFRWIRAKLAVFAASDHDRPWPSLCCLGLCRILGLLRSSRRTETDKDIEIMVFRLQMLMS